MSQQPPPPNPQQQPTPLDPQIEDLRKEVRDHSEKIVRIEERMNTQKEQVRRERAESIIDTLKWLAPVVLSIIALIVSILIGTGII